MTIYLFSQFFEDKAIEKLLGISVQSRQNITEKNFQKNQQFSEKPVRKANKYSDIKMDILMVSSRTFFEN